MATVTAPQGPRDRLLALAITVIAWFIPMAITSGVAAYTAYFYNQKANRQLVVQQQSLSDLQQFRASGAQFDQAVSSLSDVLVDEEDPSSAKREMRLAITKHLSDAVTIEHLLPPGRVKPYVAALATLRPVVDAVGTSENGQHLWQDSLNIMSARKKIILEAEQTALSAS